MARGSSGSAAAQAAARNGTLNVVSPLGEATVQNSPMAPRLGSLEGKTVCMLWNGSSKSNVTLPAIAEALLRKYPTAKVIPYTQMPHSSRAPAPGTNTSDGDAIAASLREKGCDAVISGNGG